MLTIKNKIVKKLIEFKILRSIPGRMRLKSRAPEAIYSQAEEYDNYLKKAICLLDGIEDVEINYSIGTALIQYDIEKTYELKVLNWINKIIEVGIRNQEEIMEYFSTDMDYLEKLIGQQLSEELERI